MSESVLSSLESLRKEGAHHLDPIRFHYMEVLLRRLQAQPAAVRRILEGKLQDALTDYTERFNRSCKTDNREVVNQPKPGSTPLADLNRYIQSLTQTSGDGRLGGDLLEDGVGPSDMKSVRRFSEVWSKIAAENQVDQAFGRGPDNAGPLNSHMLVLRSLTWMRDLSPDYLRRFLSQADSLLWLEQVNQQYTLADAKPARRARPKK